MILVDNPRTELLIGDCISVLKTLPDESVDCCVTSPPYYGLRDYGTAKWEPGDPDCDHLEQFTKHAGERANRDQESQKFYAKSKCSKCGAKRIDHQMGLEETPELYVEKLVKVFREVRRVLKKEGTLWLVIGDSYWGGKGQSGSKAADYQNKRYEAGRSLNAKYQQMGGKGETRPTDRKHSIIKPKDLIGIPWMVAFALRSDGWWLRQDIIWNKRNPMPESVTDRCTKSHEYLFLLSKSSKYFFDSKAIQGFATGYGGRKDTMLKGSEKYNSPVVPGQSVHTMASRGHERWKYDDAGTPVRNKRSVWSVNTKPYPGSHFATFPEELITDRIRSGCPRGGVVLYPFVGSGTPLYVSRVFGRRSIGIDLNPESEYLCDCRLKGLSPVKKDNNDSMQLSFFSGETL